MAETFISEPVRRPVWLDLPPGFKEAGGIIINPADKHSKKLLEWTCRHCDCQMSPVTVADVEPVPYTPKFVAICGASGSGKDEFAKAVLQKLNQNVLEDRLNGTVFEMDWYYGPCGLSPDGRPVCLCNFDHPGAIDLEYMLRAMKQIKAGRAVYTPRYDFAVHSRKDEHVVFPPRPVILVTGILMLHVIAARPEFAELFDLCVAIDTPEMLWREFRTNRDISERRRDPEKTFLQIEETVLPGYREFVEPYIEKIKAGTWNQTPGIAVPNRKRQHLASGQSPSFNPQCINEIMKSLSI